MRTFAVGVQLFFPRFLCNVATISDRFLRRPQSHSNHAPRAFLQQLYDDDENIYTFTNSESSGETLKIYFCLFGTKYSTYYILR